jgi:hypothetical protein
MWSAGLAVALLWSGDVARVPRTCSDATGRDPAELLLDAGACRHAPRSRSGLGRRDHCRRIFDELLPHRGGVGITGSGSSCFALVSRSLGLLALALDELPLAVELLTEAVEQADRAGAIFDGVTSRRLLATALRRTGHQGASEPLLAAASATAAERGFQREAELLRALVADNTA